MISRTSNPIIISWFSCGAASAVATKLILNKNKKKSKMPVEIVYTKVKEEHPDNMRFLRECESWFGQEIKILENNKYEGSIYKVFKDVRYLKGPSGAACTRLLKKELRNKFQRANDIHVFGYTVEESDRVDRFMDANNSVDLITPLISHGLTKSDCLAIIKDADIELPEMYKMGYKNNNCIGCVKGEAGYWNKIRKDFPDVFRRMNNMEKYLGRTVCKISMKTVKRRYPEIYKSIGSPVIPDKGATYWRPRLDELPIDFGNYQSENSISCGIFCEMAKSSFYEG